MNVIEFNPRWNRNLVFCMVDNTAQYLPSIKELIKNQADGVLANLYRKGYHVIQGTDENTLLNHAANLNYDFAVVFSTGTEFLNGRSFFNAIDELIKKDFFIIGHILDRDDGYYELHHQCYLINLNHYKNLNRPEIGHQEMFCKHYETEPIRSEENLHDNYTPLWIEKGYTEKEYQHKLHGWNIIRIGLERGLSIFAFDENIRNNKIHFYPESPDDFNKQLEWAYYRLNYCATSHVHTESTETIDTDIEKFEQIVTPASSSWFVDFVSENSTVIYYDYNQKSLDYWKEKSPKIPGVSYQFVLCDLLANTDFVDYLDPNKKTFINLSNIFNYEGTTFFYSLSYRYFKEKKLVEKIKSKIPNAVIYFTMKSKLFETIPTWHLSS